jgi:neutral amino acid transport system permease protein
MDWYLIFSNALTQALGPVAVVYVLAAIGLNVQFGYTGLLNFGQAAFAAVGAYGLAVGISSVGLPFWFAVGLGLVGAVVLALLLGIPTLRLRADYLAIATIATAEIIRRTVRASSLREWTGGSDGVRQFADTFRNYGFAIGDGLREIGIDVGLQRGGRFEYGPFFYQANHLWVMVVGWTLVAICLLVVWLAMRSPWGRVLKGIREDEDAVRSLGKNVFSYKIQSLMLGGVIGALAGFIQALRFGNVAPDQYHTTFTFYVYAVLILGGAARVFGPVLGAVTFWFLFNFLTTMLLEMTRVEILPRDLVSSFEVGSLVFVLLGGGIIAMLVFWPQGILGDKREISLHVR